ncbi:peptidase m16 inactive domain-containing protein [Cystoisospora suis]|uniref:Peptidase m16 inactive domain-containing protein n=1 Tax=Cystoisospora suis TaxID=483139 RepID=A0A2C6KBC9_9APIC|nr:peptidase m16 inactive domain-containing protein [Cystoisospora suis]
MEVHAGSTSEGDHERGMAHLCEHVSYMGSRKRERLINLQAETNAYTDFHHTVFFAAWRGGDHEEHAAEGEIGDEAETRGGKREGIGQKGQQGRPTVQRGRKREDDERFSWSNSKGIRGDDGDGSPPSQSQLTKKRLKLALEAMKEVLEAPTQFTTERLNKERAAVISEASLVNTISYRKEQLLLSRLHAETILPSRFPIGRLEQIRSWSIEDLRSFHSRHYRPENAAIYIVGDVGSGIAKDAIRSVLGPVKGKKEEQKSWAMLKSLWWNTAKQISAWFPPLAHRWRRQAPSSSDETSTPPSATLGSSSAPFSPPKSASAQAGSTSSLTDPETHTPTDTAAAVVRDNLSKDVHLSGGVTTAEEPRHGEFSSFASIPGKDQDHEKSLREGEISSCDPSLSSLAERDVSRPPDSSCDALPLSRQLHVWQHPLIQQFSLVFLLKQKIEPLKTLLDYKRLILRKLVLQALGLRLSSAVRQGPQGLQQVDVCEANSIKEGCRVLSLEVQSAQRGDDWKAAVATGIQQMRRMARYGVSISELRSLLSTYELNLKRLQLSQLASADMVRVLMESAACKHTILHLEEEKILAMSLLGVSSKKKGPLPRGSSFSEKETGGNNDKDNEKNDEDISEDELALLQDINVEARDLCEWIEAKPEIPESGPDVVLAFMHGPATAQSTAAWSLPHEGRENEKEESEHGDQEESRDDILVSGEGQGVRLSQPYRHLHHHESSMNEKPQGKHDTASVLTEGHLATGEDRRVGPAKDVEGENRKGKSSRKLTEREDDGRHRLVQEEKGEPVTQEMEETPIEGKREEEEENDDRERNEGDALVPIKKEAILTAIDEILKKDVEPPVEDVKPPDQLISPEEVIALERQMMDSASLQSLQPQEESNREMKGIEPPGGLHTSFLAANQIRLRQLPSGIKLNLKTADDEKGTAFLRLVIPGGRMGAGIPAPLSPQGVGQGEEEESEELERRRQFGAAMVIGARTMMEGGALGNYTRQQVEMFCQKNLIGVSIDCLDEFFAIDISVPTTTRLDTDDVSPSSLSSGSKSPKAGALESAFQLLRLILTSFVFEEDAFKRGKQQVLHDYEHYTKDLVAYSLGELVIEMSGDDPRFRCLRPENVKPLTLDTIRRTLLHHLSYQLAKGHMELNIVGDIDLNTTERLANVYLGKDLEIPLIRDVDPTDSSTADTVDGVLSSCVEKSRETKHTSGVLKRGLSQFKQEGEQEDTINVDSNVESSSPTTSMTDQRLNSPFIQLYHQDEERKVSSSFSAPPPLLFSPVGVPALAKENVGLNSPDSSSQSVFSATAQDRRSPSSPSHHLLERSEEKTKKKKKRVQVHVIDSDERAVIHLVGHAPNRWGIPGDDQPSSRRFFSSSSSSSIPRYNKEDGIFSLSSPFSSFSSSSSSLLPENPRRRGGGQNIDTTSSSLGSSQVDRENREYRGELNISQDRRRHPAFGRVAMWLLQEIVSKRMFSVLREERRLTYDAVFEFMAFEILRGGLYVVTVQTEPGLVDTVLHAARKALKDLATIRPIQEFQLESAKKQVISRHMHDKKLGRYWMELLAGVQLDNLPQKSIDYIKDVSAVVSSVTLDDVQELYESLGVKDEDIWEGIGISGPVPPSQFGRRPTKVSVSSKLRNSMEGR